HRRDREEPEPYSEPRRRSRRRAPARRGRFPALPTDGRALVERSLREPRDELSAPAPGGVRRHRHRHHEPWRAHRSGVPPPDGRRGALSPARRRAALAAVAAAPAGRPRRGRRDGRGNRGPLRAQRGPDQKRRAPRRACRARTRRAHRAGGSGGRDRSRASKSGRIVPRRRRRHGARFRRGARPLHGRHFLIMSEGQRVSRAKAKPDRPGASLAADRPGATSARAPAASAEWAAAQLGSAVPLGVQRKPHNGPSGAADGREAGRGPADVASGRSIAPSAISPIGSLPSPVGQRADAAPAPEKKPEKDKKKDEKPATAPVRKADAPADKKPDEKKKDEKP